MLVKKDADISKLRAVSFKVGVDSKYKDVSMDGDNWPAGVAFREFIFYDRKSTNEDSSSGFSNNHRVSCAQPAWECVPDASPGRTIESCKPNDQMFRNCSCRPRRPGSVYDVGDGVFRPLSSGKYPFHETPLSYPDALPTSSFATIASGPPESSLCCCSTSHADPGRPLSRNIASHCYYFSRSSHPRRPGPVVGSRREIFQIPPNGKYLHTSNELGPLPDAQSTSSCESTSNEHLEDHSSPCLDSTADPV